jgi:hypothetical protein
MRSPRLRIILDSALLTVRAGYAIFLRCTFAMSVKTSCARHFLGRGIIDLPLRVRKHKHAL